ncbi:3-hydroxyacyl-CoA dehydrogenase [Anopheles sinensis]|uniref:3-hydroxyacyl-CoA dehydrogenase n=1 Tax=Anopheles sinensis TaxID=74873 RepID=A0A084W1Z6_ANOSI|nr:3-hydroxyacyl-CoA dehydrogenase [Anopheles sinensis]
MKLLCAILVIVSVLLCFGRALTLVDSADDMLAEESRQLQSDTIVPADGTVREKRGLKYQYHYKEKSVGGLFPFKQTIERKVHIKHGHGLLGGGHYREVTKVKQFGLGR